jgi:hypothetical protein
MTTINRHWRVISDDLQWILQYWREPKWRNRSFCRTKEGLRRCIREYCGESNGATLLWLAGLPDWREAALCSPSETASRPPLNASKAPSMAEVE